METRPGRPAAALSPPAEMAGRCRTFPGERLRSLSPERAPKASVSAGPRADAAEVLDLHLVKHPVTGGWRLTFQVRPLSKDPIELRAYLADGDDVVTETWSYTLLP